MTPIATLKFPFAQLPHIESTPKRVRVFFGGEYIVDTTDALLVWLKPNYPYYFFKMKDVPDKYLVDAFQSQKHHIYDIVVGNRRAEAAATVYHDDELDGLIQIEFSEMDAWFEEDQQIYVHPKDPYKRVDVLQSSRHIRVEVNGVEVANSTRPRLLFETSLPVRYYIPTTDCKLELLGPSETSTQCPYKGVAGYYHINLPSGDVLEDLVWYYRTPQLECAEIRGCVAFYNEKVDIYLDGVLQPRPESPWASKRASAVVSV
uniref:BAH/PHD-containing protein n=1 Tax=Ganoderma boninense TaxID=34458 RepID=A0A5K1K0C5_9APHY|nr:BAH/PHD-containing protein [Ganoderma boninense]